MNQSTSLMRPDDGFLVPEGSYPVEPRLLPDPRMLMHIARRNLRLFLIVFSLVWIAIIAWLAVTSPLYTTHASILFEPTPSPMRTESAGAAEPAGDNEIDTEIRLMTSPEMVRRVAKAYASNHPGPSDGNWTEDDLSRLGRALLSAVEIKRDGMTYLVNVSATAEDAAFAAAAANLFASQYIQSQIEVKSGSRESADRWLKARLAELEQNAHAAQAAVDNYKVRHGLVSANGATIAEQEVSTLNQQLAAAQADLAEKRGRLRAAQSQLSLGGGGANVGAAVGSGTIGSLRQQEAQISADLAEMEQRYGPEYPARKQMEQKLAQTQASIQQEIDRVISSLSGEVQTAQSRLASIQASRGAAAGALNANGAAQAGLNELVLKAEAAQTVYQDFLERSSEVSAEKFLQQPDAQIVREADVPSLPTYPNYTLVGLGGLFLSLVAGLGAVGVSEYLRRGVETKQDVEHGLHVQYAGAIPTLASTTRGADVHMPPHAYVATHPHSLFAEAFRNIRMFLTLSAAPGPQVLAITSALPQEGKTTTSACLALTSAQGGIKTILVDTDFRRRGASRLFGIEDQPDLASVLDGSASLEQAVYIDQQSGLHILGLAPLSNRTDSFSQASLHKLISELKQRYEVVVLDTALLLGVADARQFACAADRVLLLARWRHTSAKAVEAAVDILYSSGARLAGAALSQVDISRYASAGEGDLFSYSKQFSGYYVN